jgi:hypothetical protein
MCLGNKIDLFEKIDLTEHHFKTDFFYLNIGRGVESILGPLGTAATTGLLYLPRVIVRMEKLVE